MNTELFERMQDLSGIVMILLRTGLLCLVWRLFLPKEADKRVRFIVLAALLAGQLALWFGTQGLLSIWYLPVAIVMLTYALLRQRAHIREAVFAVLLFFNLYAQTYFAANSFSTIVSDLAFRGTIQSEAQINVIVILLFFAGSLLVVLLLFAEYAVLRAVIKKTAPMNWTETAFLSVLNVIGIILTNMIADISLSRISQGVVLYEERPHLLWLLPLTSVLILAGEFAALLAWQKYAELREYERSYFAESQQRKALQARLEETEQFYDGIRKARHEMKNHMTALRGLAQAGQYDEMDAYIGRLDETVSALDLAFQTGNPITDVILNDKYHAAQNKGIAFTTNFLYDSACGIPAYDVGVIVNNLLENAIEACDKLTDAKRYIVLNARYKPNFLLIEAENSFDGNITWTEEQLPQSSKPDADAFHGMGLKNVRDIAERYLGGVKFTSESKVFRVSVMLQCGVHS
ncbi:MAG: GHKL domain-containing protein [Oscillospiraceae bacterium]|nr:GHKL domain-containing protein [Oscillospiraceae bacterium]